MGEPYGSKKLVYARPFADGLIASSEFRTWVLGRAGLGDMASGSEVLNEEMKAARSKTASTWWRSHYTGKCLCDGCRGGQETDLLAIFQLRNTARFALHVEVKQPRDRFPAHKDQAANYTLRAKCWAGSPPSAVLLHSGFQTMLLCSTLKTDDYSAHLPKFGSIATFEEISALFSTINFPNLHSGSSIA